MKNGTALPAPRLYAVTSATVGYEVRPRNAVSFLSEVDLTEAGILYYRGMGATMPATAYTSSGVKLADPWALKVGPDVVLGQEAMISGHKIERDIVTLGTVELGGGALIGARCIILPGVRIGDGAVIGANSVVTRGTVVPAGETWAGNPARRIEPLPERSSRKRLQELAHVG